MLINASAISMKEYQSIFKDFGFVIYDECHHLGAETFSRALLKTGCKYGFKCYTKPRRWFNKSISMAIDIVYKINKRDDNNVNVKLIKYVPPQGDSLVGMALDEDDLEEMNQTYDDDCLRAIIMWF